RRLVAATVATAGAAGIEPDVLATLARIRFPGVAGTAAVVSAIEEEALTGVQLAHWLNAETRSATAAARSAAFARVGGRGDAPAAISMVVWQSVLWEHAATVDVAATASVLERWWAVPDPDKAGQDMVLALPF